MIVGLVSSIWFDVSYL